MAKKAPAISEIMSKKKLLRMDGLGRTGLLKSISPGSFAQDQRLFEMQGKKTSGRLGWFFGPQEALSYYLGIDRLDVVKTTILEAALNSSHGSDSEGNLTDGKLLRVRGDKVLWEVDLTDYMVKDGAWIALEHTDIEPQPKTIVRALEKVAGRVAGRNGRCSKRELQMAIRRTSSPKLNVDTHRAATMSAYALRAGCGDEAFFLGVAWLYAQIVQLDGEMRPAKEARERRKEVESDLRREAMALKNDQV
jgi:hypothetical protein